MTYPLQLTGTNVRLREFRADDLDDVHAIDGDERVTRWLSFDSRSREQSQRGLEGILERARNEPRTEYYLAITTRDDDLVVGFVRLGLDGVQAGKLGFAVHADHWGRGIATDAVRTLTDFGFHTLGLHRVSAAIGPENDASVAVAKRLGMTYEGRIRHHVHTNGDWRDSLLYSVLEPEWRLSG